MRYIGYFHIIMLSPWYALYQEGFIIIIIILIKKIYSEQLHYYFYAICVTDSQWYSQWYFTAAPDNQIVEWGIRFNTLEGWHLVGSQLQFTHIHIPTLHHFLSYSTLILLGQVFLIIAYHEIANFYHYFCD